MPPPRNLFYYLPSGPDSEQFLTLFESAGVKIERIVSRSATSPQGFWYDQDHDEWIAVIKGTAVLQFSDGNEVIMNIGDYLLIPKHEKHRVESTSEEVVWLAVRVKPLLDARLPAID